MSQFGKRMKEVREDRGISQIKLAELLNVWQSAVSKWELGFREPSIVMIKKISEILECDARYLLGIIDYFD